MYIISIVLIDIIFIFADDTNSTARNENTFTPHFTQLQGYWPQ
jgi:hypothetical protein